MSERTPQKVMRDVEGDDEAVAFYVYCVGHADELRPLLVEDSLPPALEESSRLELVDAGGLAAVVSAVPLADYGGGAMETRMQDPSWVAVRAMRHERAVEHFARRASVVPLRFGTIYLSRARVGEMLAERADELRAGVERLRGREEWGVNVYFDRARLKETVVELSPRLSQLAAQAAAAPPGQSYLLRKKIDAMRADEVRATSRGVAHEVETELSAVSDASARLRVLKDESGEHGDVAAKLAFLVSREGFPDFRAAAERLAARYDAHGFRLELTGPWPAYNFATGE